MSLCLKYFLLLTYLLQSAYLTDAAPPSYVISNINSWDADLACQTLRCDPVPERLCVRIKDSEYVIVKNRCDLQWLICYHGRETFEVAMVNCEREPSKSIRVLSSAGDGKIRSKGEPMNLHSEGDLDNAIHKAIQIDQKLKKKGAQNYDIYIRYYDGKRKKVNITYIRDPDSDPDRGVAGPLEGDEEAEKDVTDSSAENTTYPYQTDPSFDADSNDNDRKETSMKTNDHQTIQRTQIKTTTTTTEKPTKTKKGVKGGNGGNGGFGGNGGLGGHGGSGGNGGLGGHGGSGGNGVHGGKGGNGGDAGDGGDGSHGGKTGNGGDAGNGDDGGKAGNGGNGGVLDNLESSDDDKGTNKATTEEFFRMQSHKKHRKAKQKDRSEKDYPQVTKYSFRFKTKCPISG